MKKSKQKQFAGRGASVVEKINTWAYSQGYTYNSNFNHIYNYLYLNLLFMLIASLNCGATLYVIISIIFLQESPFTYGFNGNAKYQLISLAAMSRQALQSLEYDCKEGRSARQLIGYNGAEIPVTESFHNLLQTVDVELNCEVCVTGTSEIQNHVQFGELCILVRSMDRFEVVHKQ